MATNTTNYNFKKPDESDFYSVQDQKAAFKGACLIGQIVNNCVTNNAKLPLSAAQGKALMDLYTQLNSDLANKLDSSAIIAQYNKL